MPNAIFRGKRVLCDQRSEKEEKCMQIMITIIGICAIAMLLWYVYILMKGDDQV